MENLENGTVENGTAEIGEGTKAAMGTEVTLVDGKNAEQDTAVQSAPVASEGMETSSGAIETGALVEKSTPIYRLPEDRFLEIYRDASLEERKAFVKARLEHFYNQFPELRDQMDCAYFYATSTSVKIPSSWDLYNPSRSPRNTDPGKRMPFYINSVDELNKQFFGRDISRAEAAKFFRASLGITMMQNSGSALPTPVESFSDAMDAYYTQKMFEANPGRTELRSATPEEVAQLERAKRLEEEQYARMDDWHNKTFLQLMLSPFEVKGQRYVAGEGWKPFDDNLFNVAIGNVVTRTVGWAHNVGRIPMETMIRLFGDDDTFEKYRKHSLASQETLKTLESQYAAAIQPVNANLATRIADGAFTMAPDFVRIAVLGGAGANLSVLEGFAAAGDKSFELDAKGADDLTRNIIAAADGVITYFTWEALGKIGKAFAPGVKYGGKYWFNDSGLPGYSIVDKAGNVVSKGFVRGDFIRKELAGKAFGFSLNLVKKSATDAVLRILGVTASNAAVGAISKFIENGIEVAAGVRPEEKRWEGVGDAATFLAAFGAFSAASRYANTPEGIFLTRGNGQAPVVTVKWASDFQKMLGDMANGEMPKLLPNGEAPVAPQSPATALPELPPAIYPARYSPAFLCDVANPVALKNFVARQSSAIATDLDVNFARLAPEEMQQQLTRWKELASVAPQADVSDLPDEIETKEAAQETLAIDGIARAQLFFRDRAGILAHSVEATLDAVSNVAREWEKYGIKIHAFSSAKEFPEAIIKAIKAQGRNPDHINAVTDGEDVYINAQNMRPSQVGRIVLNHELGSHIGLRRILPPEALQKLWGVVRQSAGSDLKEFCDRTGYDVSSDQAVEEFIAERFELGGNDWRKLYADNKEAIDEYAGENGYSTASEEFQRRATIGYFDARELPKVPWYEKLYAVFKKWIRSTFAGRLAKFSDIDMRKLFRDALKGLKRGGAQDRGSGGVRFSTMGDIGAIRLGRAQDLETAKLMQDFGKDMLTIKLATGFEFQDHRWKLEQPDLQLKDNFPEIIADLNAAGSKILLGSIVYAPEIFTAYPELRNMPVKFVWFQNTDGSFSQNVAGMYDDGDKTIYLRQDMEFQKSKELRNVLIHEVQHAIQHIEGFPSGGNPEMFSGKLEDVQNDIAEFRAVADKSQKYLRYEELNKGISVFLDNNQYGEADWDNWYEENRAELEKLHDDPEVQHIIDLKNKVVEKYGYNVYVANLLLNPNDENAIQNLQRDDEGYKIRKYRVLAGEVEARNAERRADMSDEKRRNSLLDDTADTIPGMRIYLDGGGGASADIAEFEDGVRFVDVQVDQELFNGLDKKQSIRLAKKIIKFRFLNKIVGNKNKAFLNGDGVGEFLYPSTHIKDDIIYKAKMRTSSELDNLLDVGTRMPDKPDGVAGHTHQNVKNFSYFDVVFKIGNRYYDGTINIINNKRGKLFKDITQIEDITDVISDSYGKNPKFEYIRDASNNNINASGDLSSGILENSDNLRMKIEEFADEDMKVLVDAAKDFAGKHYYDVKSDAEFLEFFKRHGLPVENEHDAHFIMTLALEEVKHERAVAGAKRAAKTKKINEARALKEFADENPLFAFLQSFVGNDFTINPGKRFEGLELTGDYISPEFKKYGNKEPKGKRTDKQYQSYLARREEALANASGFNLDEVAQAYASQHGGDPAVIEEEIMALIGDLRKKEIYAEYRDRISEEKAEALRLKEDAEKEYLDYLDGEIEKIFESQGEVTKEMLDADRKLAKMLYAKTFGKKLEGEITQGEVAAINAAIKREANGGEAPENDGGEVSRQAFAQAYLAARDEIIAEYRAKYKEFRDKLLSEHGAREKDARDLVFSAMPPEMRARYLAKIIALGKLPAGKREAALDALMEEITAEGRTGRAKDLVGRFDRRLKQLHVTVDQSRRLVGTRSEEYQKILDEIGKIRAMSIAEVNAEKVKLTEEIDALPDRSEGDGVVDESTKAQERLALLEEFGDLENQDPDAIKKALLDLNKFAKTGRIELLDKIAERRAKDEALRNFIIDRITKGKGVKTGQAAIDANIEAKENPPKLANYTYGLLKLEDFLYLLSTNGEKGDWLENPVGKVFQGVHTSAVEEATRGREFADYRDELLNEVLGAKTAVGRVAKLQKYRERIEHTGIYRFDPAEREVSYEDIPLSEAKALLAKFDRGESVPYNEFQMEFLRDAIRAGELKIERSFKPIEEDKVTEAVSGAVDREVKDAARENQVEPTIGVPSVKFKGSYEMQRLNQLELLDMYLGMNQRDVRYKMWANGFTEESFKAIDKILAPEMKALGDAMTDFLEQQGNELNELQKELFFAGIDQIDNYFPMVYESRSVTGAKTAPALDDPDTAKKAPARLAPGSLKVRNAHLMEPKFGDALVIFENAVRRTRHYLAFAKVARDLRGALLTPEIKKACDQVFGTGFFKNLRNAVVDTINGGNANAEYIALYQLFYGNAVSMKMMFNLLSGIKQTMSGFAYANDMPLADFALNVAKVWAHPKETFGVLLQSDYLKNRFFGGPDAHAALVFDGKNQYVANSMKFEKLSRKLKVPASILAGTGQAIANIKDWGGIFTRLGDATPCVIMGAALYNYHYNRMLDQGFPADEAKKHALLRWEMATESMQQSAAVHNQNAMQRSTLMKPFTAWKSSQTLLGQRFWRELIAGKVFGGRKTAAAESDGTNYTGTETFGRTATATKALISAWIISALITAVGSAWFAASKRNKKKSKKEMEQNAIADYALDAMVGALSDTFDVDPLAGDAIDLAYNAIQKKQLSAGDKQMFVEDAFRAAMKTKSAVDAADPTHKRKNGEKSAEEKIYDAVSEDLKAMGVLSPLFQITGSSMHQAKRLWDLWVGGERDAVPQVKTKKRASGKRRKRRKRIY